MDGVKCGEAKIYLAGQEIGYLDAMTWVANPPPIPSTAEILDSIKSVQQTVKFECKGDLVDTNALKDFLPPQKRIVIMADNKSQIRKIRKNFEYSPNNAAEAFVGAQLITVLLPSKGTRKYLKRMKNRPIRSKKCHRRS